jgi:hypothetical protein
VFLGHTTLFQNLTAFHKINLFVIKCKNVSSDISLKNILGSLHTYYDRLHLKMNLFWFVFLVCTHLLLHRADRSNVIIKVVKCKKMLSELLQTLNLCNELQTGICNSTHRDMIWNECYRTSSNKNDQ